VWLVAAIVLAAGCQPSKKRDEGSSSTIQQTTRNVRKSLDRLQQMGQVDLNDRLALELIWNSYRGAVARGTAPQNWSDLQGAAAALGLDAPSLRDAERSGIKINWELLSTEPPATADDSELPRVLAYHVTDHPAGVNLLLADGQIRFCPPNEFDPAKGQIKAHQGP